MTGFRTTGTRQQALHVDWTACDGRGLCSELLARVDRDPWGYPLLRDGGSDLPLRGDEIDAASDAVALCPRQALSIRMVKRD